MIYDLIRYFDMFAGIGGFRAGLTRAGGFQCVGHCEIDKYADASYRAIHNPGKEELYYPDARTIDPRRRKYHILRFAASVKAQSFRCSSFQNRTRCAGLRFCFPSGAPRRNPAERFRWGEEAQGSDARATSGSTSKSGLCDDVLATMASCTATPAGRQPNFCPCLWCWPIGSPWV